MRKFPDTPLSQQDAHRLQAEQWQLDILKMNPEYVWWGNYEDYMSNQTGTGLDSSLEFPNWKAFRAEWGTPNELNEFVNFYFFIKRDSAPCPNCFGSGYNRETHLLSESFYSDWHDKITQDEADMLWEQGRLQFDFKEKPTAQQVNDAQHRTLGHDSINKMLLVEYRARARGVFGICNRCKGEGELFTEPEAHLALQLWVLHPRKGASRGVVVLHLDKEDVLEAAAFLKLAAQRNVQRFAGLDLLINRSLEEGGDA